MPNNINFLFVTLFGIGKLKKIPGSYASLFTTIFSLFLVDFSSFGILNWDLKFYLNFFLVSIGAMSFGTTVYMYSTSIIGPVKASVFIFSVPFIAMGISSIFLNEIITINTILGAVLSLIAIYIVNK